MVWKWMVGDDDHRVDACVCSLVSVQVLLILLWLRFSSWDGRSEV